MSNVVYTQNNYSVNNNTHVDILQNEPVTAPKHTALAHAARPKRRVDSSGAGNTQITGPYWLETPALQKVTQSYWTRFPSFIAKPATPIV